jgi:hypothetical protein
MDWETVGRKVMQGFRAAKRVDCDEAEFNRRLVAHGGRPIRLEPREFPTAIIAYLAGDHTKIVEYLCSHQLSRNQQAELSWAIEERARVKKGRPESLEHMNRKEMASCALQIYSIWKMENERLGIKDWGHREEMKYQACEFAVEQFAALGITGCADVDAIWELIKQPKSRRK